LTADIWQKKYYLMTTQYGYKKDSWEAETTPKAEAFWEFSDPADAIQWLDRRGKL
jgi:hypothetical protein